MSENSAEDRGHVWIERSASWFPAQYHSEPITVGLRLPIEPGETPQEAIDRVFDEVTMALSEKISDAIEAGGIYAETKQARAVARGRNKRQH